MNFSGYGIITQAITSLFRSVIFILLEPIFIHQRSNTRKDKALNLIIFTIMEEMMKQMKTVGACNTREIIHNFKH